MTFDLKTAGHIQALKPSYIREILHAATTPGMISLAGGLPATESFPMDILAEAMPRVAEDPNLFQYGQTAGYPPLISHLRERYALADDHDVLVCNGSQQALDLIARAYLAPGDGVAMEMPGYLGALQIFRIAQARIEPVAQDDQGPDLAQLESAFKAGRVKLFYAVPDFHNPSGVCWSLARRQAVGELCQRYDIGLIEDSPYRDIRFTGEMLPMASSFCPCHALTMRSFSKTVTPGMRIGTVSSNRRWVEPLNRIKQAADLHSNLPLQAALLYVLESPGFPGHRERVNALYGERYAALASSIQKHLGERGSFDAVEGGMFIWLKLHVPDAMRVAQIALDNGVAVVPGDVFYPDDRAPYAALRLNFSHSTAEQFEEAMIRLGPALD